jgi:hypothetical protein
MISTPSCLRTSRKARFPDMTGKESSKCWEPEKEAGRGDLAIDIGGGDDGSHASISRRRSQDWNAQAS